MTELGYKHRLAWSNAKSSLLSRNVSGGKEKWTNKEGEGKGDHEIFVAPSLSCNFPSKLLFPKFAKHTLSQRLCLPQSFFFFLSIVSLLISWAPASEPSQSIRKEERKIGTTGGRGKIKEPPAWQHSLIMAGRRGGVSAAPFFVLMLQLSFIYTLYVFFQTNLITQEDLESKTSE